jgi:hypothetical protein
MMLKSGYRFSGKIMRNEFFREVVMRFAAVALSAVALVVALASAAEAQKRRPYRDQTERITIIDENGRVRTRVTVRPRSYLDGGTEVVPGERKFTDYLYPPTYMNGSAYANWDPTGIHYYPLPNNNYLPGFNPWVPF